ncbi:hypothetical protein J6590_080040 [Homalodisca vitripennis]|nr:hypothetical protein J6590_080040 [Homalodisca vitripennis]
MKDSLKNTGAESLLPVNRSWTEPKLLYFSGSVQTFAAFEHAKQYMLLRNLLDTTGGHAPPTPTQQPISKQRGQANVLMVIKSFMGCTCETAGAGEHQWAINYPAGAVSRLGHCYWNVSDTT